MDPGLKSFARPSKGLTVDRPSLGEIRDLMLMDSSEAEQVLSALQALLEEKQQLHQQLLSEQAEAEQRLKALREMGAQTAALACLFLCQVAAWPMDPPSWPKYPGRQVHVLNGTWRFAFLGDVALEVQLLQAQENATSAVEVPDAFDMRPERPRCHACWPLEDPGPAMHAMPS
eukprot:s993_g21.t1